MSMNRNITPQEERFNKFTTSIARSCKLIRTIIEEYDEIPRLYLLINETYADTIEASFDLGVEVLKQPRHYLIDIWKE